MAQCDRQLHCRTPNGDQHPVHTAGAAVTLQTAPPRDEVYARMRLAEAVFLYRDVEGGVRHNSDLRRCAPRTCVFVHGVWRWARRVPAEAEWGAADSPAGRSQRVRVDQLAVQRFVSVMHHSFRSCPSHNRSVAVATRLDHPINVGYRVTKPTAIGSEDSPPFSVAGFPSE